MLVNGWAYGRPIAKRGGHTAGRFLSPDGDNLTALTTQTGYPVLIIGEAGV